LLCIVLNNEPDWISPVSAILPPIPDVLPQVQTSEDWQAAFGFSNSSNSYQSSDINRTMVNTKKIIIILIISKNFFFFQQLNLSPDEDIFNSVSVTQRALSEYMEQQNHLNMYQSRLQNSGYEYTNNVYSI